MTPLAARMESALLPLPDTIRWERGKIQKVELSTLKKVETCVFQVFSFVGYLALLPFAAVGSIISSTVSIFQGSSRQAELALEPSDPILPPHIGFADSLFQSSGLGTSASATHLSGKCDWNNWLSAQHIEGSPNYQEIFVDILRNPQPFIDILKKLHVTAHRFSLEWAVIEPEKGRYDHEAIRLYRNFIQELKKEGIEPYVTLHHFVLPEWFSKENDFENFNQIDLFVNHSIEMMKTFPEVKYWMTFNEPGVYAFSNRIRGVFPPGVQGDLFAAAQVLRNLLIAHCKIYKAAKENFGDRVEIGITHQWLKFVPLQENGNAVERTICYFLSKITHYCVYNFFKTGHFDFEVPAKANVHFDISEEEFKKNNRFLDFIGVQFYGYPRLKAGWNGGEEYPGYKIVNSLGFTFGSTCPKGGKTMSFGPGFYPESLQNCLEEAAALGKPIAITETGCDARIQKWGSREWVIDDETQREYFIKILPILNRFRNQLKAFFVWTLYRGQLEWDRGDFPRLGVAKLTQNKARVITGCELSLAAKHLQMVFQKKRQAV